jgi:glutamate synthase (ferredoxin)
MADRVAWIASAKLGFPDRAIVAICLGADLINIARESMLAIGCIQAQKCHTGHCPTGVATHDRGLQRGLEPLIQASRFARYLKSFRNELLAITHACGYKHPSEFTGDDVEISTGPAQFRTLRDLEGYTPSRAKRQTV